MKAGYKIGQTLIRLVFALGISVLLLIMLSNLFVFYLTKDKLFEDLEELPFNKVGLVPGTSKYTRRGEINPFFTNRINAAVSLFNVDKINYILVSGDNSTSHYNEPVKMRDALIEKGIPGEKIVLDFAGLRTLDSVIRAKEVFGLSEFTFISQKFQDRRAVFIAQANNINMISFSAADVKGYAGFKVKTREAFARVLVIADIYLTHRQPKYLGEMIQIGE